MYDCEEMYKLLQISTRVIKRTTHVSTRTNLAATLSDMVQEIIWDLGYMVEDVKMVITVSIHMQ